jgi:hypothetical protein
LCYKLPLKEIWDFDFLRAAIAKKGKDRFYENNSGTGIINLARINTSDILNIHRNYPLNGLTLKSDIRIDTLFYEDSQGTNWTNSFTMKWRS